MLKFSDESVTWMMDRLEAFTDMVGFPTKPQGVKVYAEAVLRIAHPEFVKLRWEYGLQGKDDPKELTETITGKNLEDVVVVGHPKLGTVNPVAWLIAECADSFKFCPKPIEMRQIFDAQLPCADGKTLGATEKSPDLDRE